MTPWISIFIPISALGFIVSIYFFSKKEEFNRLFAFILFLFGLNILCNICYWYGLSSGNQKYFVLTFSLYLIPLSLYGPLFYLYIRNVIQKTTLRSYDLIHLLPFVLTLFLYGGFLFLKPSLKLKIAKARQISEHIIWVPHYEKILVVITLAYVLSIYWKFKSKYDDTPALKTWLLYITACFLGFVGAYILYEVLVIFSLLKIEYDYIIALAMAIFIFTSSYFAFWQADIFNGKPIQEIIPFHKYKTKQLEYKLGEELKEKLIKLVEEEKLYLNPDLRLDDVAEAMGIQRNLMSQLINNKFNMNFNSFINTYRITEAEKLLLLEEENLSIKEILYRSGFNNRTSFFKSFKSKHNMTPLQFKALKALKIS